MILCTHRGVTLRSFYFLLWWIWDYHHCLHCHKLYPGRMCVLNVCPCVSDSMCGWGCFFLFIAHQMVWWCASHLVCVLGWWDRGNEKLLKCCKSMTVQTQRCVFLKCLLMCVLSAVVCGSGLVHVHAWEIDSLDIGEVRDRLMLASVSPKWQMLGNQTWH